jgi:hypothetical protein
MADKYLILCNRHPSIFGNNFAVWWGYKENKGGYSSDFRHAHLYDYEYVKNGHLNCKDDPAIKLSDLGYTEEQFMNLPKDENLRVFIEKGTLNEILGLRLKPRRGNRG